MPIRVSAALGLLLVGTAFLYGSRLDETPAFLMQDEVNFALQAQSIQATGRDTNGRRFPVYFSEAGFEAGRDPVLIYAQALVLSVLPLSEFAVRLPTVCAGVLSVGLMFLVARRLLESDWLGIAAAALLAITPGHFINSRLALSVIYPVPFALLWLWSLPYLERHAGAAVGAGLSLGLGLYSYVASLVVMPICLAFTVALLWRQQRARSAALAVATFAVALIPMLWWQVEHPDRYGELFRVYRPGGVLQVRERLDVLWSFFSPDYLFISGDARLTNAVRTAGMFSGVCGLLMPLGAFSLVRRRRGDVGWVVLAAFIAAPSASALLGRLDINRVLVAIPFGVLIAVSGLDALWSHARTSTRVVAACLMVMAGVQFRNLQADYFGPYRTLSAPWFGGNARGAVLEVVHRLSPTDLHPVYLNARSPIERYWRFYCLAQGRADLVGQPTYYDPEAFEVSAPVATAILVAAAHTPLSDRLEASGLWREVAEIRELDGAVSLIVYERL
jgi:4-amino-4-deoxy-L-arabinose transferase-like glycosyltransferase